MRSTRLMLLATAFALVTGCAAPRAVIWDGTSVERWHVEGHVGMIGVGPTATAEAVGTGAINVAKTVTENDTLKSQELLRDASRSLVAASLDMPGANFVASAHMGLGWGLEAGYRREGGANAWSLRWQFLSAKDADWNGGIGVMYSTLDYDLPSVLSDVQKALGYEFKRKDISIPLVFTKPIGEDGKYGSFGGGLVGAWTSTHYGFDPNGLFATWKSEGGQASLLDKLPDQTTSFYSYGGFAVGKFGYKHVWLMVGMTVVYQDYGTYQIPETDPVSLSGFTFLPHIGVEFRI